MAKSVLDIVIKLTKEGGADKETVSSLVQLKGAITNAAAVAGTLVAAGYSIKKVFDATVGTTVELADKVRAFSQVTGLSAEESSKLIQVADDMKVSFEALQKVVQKNGDTFDYSTEGLAKMSDEYNNLGTAQEKAEFMQKRFGKSWGEFVELMQQGGDAIRKAGDSINKGLIFDQQQLDSAREYEMAVDNLGDTWNSVQVVIGNAVIPTLNQLLISIQKNIEGTDSLLDVGKGWLEFLYKGGLIGEVYRAHVDAETIALYAARDAVNAHADALDGALPVQQAMNDGIYQTTVNYKDQLSLIGQMQSAQESYQKRGSELDAERIKLEEEKATLLSQGYTSQSQQILDINSKLGENSLAVQQNANDYDMAGKKIILSLLEQQMAQDGLTQQEMTYLLQKGQAWGVYSNTVVTEAQKAYDEVQLINQAINTIPEKRTFQMAVLVSGADAIGGLGGASFGSSGFKLPGKAIGGPVSGGQAYVVGEKGPEVFVPGSNGTIIPNGGGGGINININYNPMMSSASRDEVMSSFIPMVEQAVRQLRIQGGM